jgi:hypothetical protein
MVMPRVTIADQIECLEQLRDESNDRPIRAGVLQAAIRSLKDLDYQQIERKRRERENRKIERVLAQPSEDERPTAGTAGPSTNLPN